MADNSQYPRTLFGLIMARLATIFRAQNLYSETIPSEGNRLANTPRSVFLRHLDCGSCNACELELNALSNPLYDSERFGIKFEASPRHADALVLTGAFTHNLTEAAQLTLAAMSAPQRVITIGDCALDGGVFHDSYAVAQQSNVIKEAVVAHIPGCPPTPADILRALAEVNW